MTKLDLSQLYLLPDLRFQETTLMLLDSSNYQSNYKELAQKALSQSRKLNIRFSTVDLLTFRGHKSFDDLRTLEFRQCVFDHLEDLDLFLGRCRNIESISLLANQDSE